MSSPVSPFRFPEFGFTLSRSGNHIKVKKGSQEVALSLNELIQTLPPLEKENETNVAADIEHSRLDIIDDFRKQALVLTAKEPERALLLYKKAEELGDLQSLKDRAGILKRLGRIDELMECLTKVATDSPLDKWLHSFIFFLNTRESFDALNTLADLKVPLAIYHLGLLAEKTDFIAALRVFSTMGKKDPYALKLLTKHSQDYNEKIRQLFESGRIDDLIQLSNSKIPTVNFYLGLHHEQNNAPEKALEQYLKINKKIVCALDLLKERAATSPLAAEALSLLLSADHA